MLFGVTFQSDEDKRYRLIFLSNRIAAHLKIDTSIKKEDLEELIEHTMADAKAFKGTDLEEFCAPKPEITKKNRFKPRFILFRMQDKKREEEEMKKSRIEMSVITQKNNETLERMLKSSSSSFRIIQSETLPTAYEVDLFYDKREKDEIKTKKYEFDEDEDDLENINIG